MRTPTRLELMLERLAIVDEQIDTLQARLSRLRQRRPGVRLDEFERALALLIDSRGVLHACAEAIRVREVVQAPQRESPQQVPSSRDDFGAAEVAIRDPESVRHWCSVFGCNEADLIQAVWKSGPWANAVAAYLARAADAARGAGGT